MAFLSHLTRMDADTSGLQLLNTVKHTTMNKKYATICARELFEDNQNHSHQLPIFQTSSFEPGSMERAVDLFSGKEKGYVYTRYGNPTIDAVQNKLALLEGLGSSEDCFCILTSSGMSAISTLIQAVLEPGKAILIHPSLYGGTLEYMLHILPGSGHEVIQVDFNDSDGLKKVLAERSHEIGMIYFETPTNPGLEIIDISAVCKLAKKAGIPAAVDNTFCTSFLQQPLSLGADYVVYSTTKFINGHGNSTGGAILGKKGDPNEKPIWKNMKLLGTCIGPFEAWLINQGLKTLPLRMEKHCNNALKIARYLEAKNTLVNRVNYPGLKDNPGHRTAGRQMNLPGSMLSFELDADLKKCLEFCDALHFSKAPTLGDTDTLLLHPASSSHINVDPEIRLKSGITDGLIRLSVGIEDAEDLISDLESAFAAIS